MSSILKALKKLEQEKSVRKPDSFKIDSEILRGSTHTKASGSRTALATLVLFLCGVGGTYLYMRQERTIIAPAPLTKPSAPIIKDETSTGASSVPVTSKIMPEPQKKRSEQVIPVVISPAVPAATPLTHDHILIQKPAESSKPTALPDQVKNTPPAPNQQPLPIIQPSPRPVLKVHGIAYQDGAESAAVINGNTVTKGSVIEGAKVEEIQKDRVRFSRGGEKFEVYLDKSN